MSAVLRTDSTQMRWLSNWNMGVSVVQPIVYVLDKSAIPTGIGRLQRELGEIPP